MGVSSSTTECSWEVVLWRNGLTPSLRETWEDLLQRVGPVSVFCRPEWLEIAWHAGVAEPWGVVIIRSAGKPIGLFPLQKVAPWCWEVISHWVVGEPHYLIDSRMEAQAWDGLFQWKKSLPQPALLSIAVLDDVQLAHLESYDRNGFAVRRRLHRLPVVISSLPASWDAFLAGLPSSTRKDILRAERALLRDYPDFTIEYITDPETGMQALEILMDMYCARWSDQPGGCCFDDPRQRHGFREAMRWALSHGYAAISRLSVSGRPVIVSSMLYAPGNPVLYEHVIARDPELLPNKYSPGLVESNFTIRWAIEHGFTSINQGFGNSRYKQMYEGKSYPLWEVTVARSALSRLLLTGMRSLLHLCNRAPTHLKYHWERLAKRDNEVQRQRTSPLRFG